MVMVELPAPGAGIGFGLKLTVVPVGTPEAERLMSLLKPPLMVVVMVDVPWLPCAMLSEAGEAEMVKLGVCVTFRDAMGVRSPLALFVPTTTVSRLPASVTAWLTFLVGQSASDQLFP